MNGNFVAVASKDSVIDHGQFIDGRITLFRRLSSGQWALDQVVRDSSFHAGYPADQLVFREDSIFTTFGGIAHFELIGGLWQYQGQIGRDIAFALGSRIYAIASDGETLMGSVQQILDPVVLIFERASNGWSLVTTLRESQFDINECLSQAAWGTLLEVEGDVAVLCALQHCSAGFERVGRVFVLRRAAGVWSQEQTIDYPGTPTFHNMYFGSDYAVRGDELFIGCSGEGSVYVYRYAPATGWTLESCIQPTGASGQAILGGGAFGISIDYMPPTLVVGASTLRQPGGAPGTPAYGSGTIFAFERCGDVWNQRTVMIAPPAFGNRGIGQFMDADGTSVVTGSPYVQYPDPVTGVTLQQAGVAAVATLLPPSSSTECTEIGRVVCTPADPATTTCPCSPSAVEPGRGCPNSTGRGARLFCHGGFDQRRLDRVLVEDLPPGTTVLLAIGTPSPAPHTGIVAGAGVTCLGQVLVTTVSRADASGTATFDDVRTLPWSLLGGTFGFLMPLQAIYRDPAGPCNAAWNATNAVAFSLGL